MLLQEPPPSQYDLRFRIGDIPVRVHPLFWLVALALGAQARDPKIVLIWVVALFGSILVHELGHALAARWFGNRPRIVLYGAGGLAVYLPQRETFASRLIVLLAGPGAGFVLAAVLLGGLWLGDVKIFSHPLDRWIDLSGGHRVPGPYAQDLIHFVFLICVWWGLVNLLPIYPLDGGQISRLLFLRRDGILGASQAMMLSLWTAGGVALYCGLEHRESLFLPVFFGFLAYENYRALPSQQRWR